MKLLRTIFKFYINASIHVAFGVLAFVLLTVWEFNLHLSLPFWGFIFFGTVTGYNFVKYAKVAGLHHRSLTESLRSIQVFSFLCFVGLIVCSFYIQLKTIMATSAFGLMTFLYAVPFLGKKSLRTFSGIKIFVVGLVWAGITVFVPMIEAKMNPTLDCWLAFSQRFLLVVVLTLPFEIRDLKYDIAHLRTLPQQLGIRGSKGLGSGMLLVVLALEGFKSEINSLRLFEALILVGLTMTALLNAKEKQFRYYASFWVEGIPIAAVFLALLLRHFLQ